MGTKRIHCTHVSMLCPSTDVPPRCHRLALSHLELDCNLPSYDYCRKPRCQVNLLCLSLLLYGKLSSEGMCLAFMAPGHPCRRQVEHLPQSQNMIKHLPHSLSRNLS